MPSVVALPYKRNNRLDRNKIYAILEAALAVVVWGAAIIAIKIALREVQPLTVYWLLGPSVPDLARVRLNFPSSSRYFTGKRENKGTGG